MRKRLIVLCISIIAIMIPTSAFAGTAEFVCGDDKITMEVSGSDVSKSVERLKLNSTPIEMDIDSDEVSKIYISYENVNELRGNKCESADEAAFIMSVIEDIDNGKPIKGNNGRYFLRVIGDGVTEYYTVMDDGITACISMSKEEKGGYIFPVNEAAADKIIQSYEDTGVYYQYKQLRDNLMIFVILLIGAVFIALFIIIEKFRKREKKVTNVNQPKYDPSQGIKVMDSFISQTKPGEVAVLTVAGYFGRMSTLRTFRGGLKEKAEECIKYIESDIIREGKAAGGITRVNYNIELVKKLVVSGLCTSDEGTLCIGILEKELVMAVPCEKAELKEEKTREFLEAGYKVYEIEDVVKPFKEVETSFDEKKKLLYVTVPVDSYFSISDKMRDELNYASKGGHHHAFS